MRRRWVRIVPRKDGSYTVKDYTGRVYATYRGRTAYNDAQLKLRQVLKEKRG